MMNELLIMIGLRVWVFPAFCEKKEIAKTLAIKQALRAKSVTCCSSVVICDETFFEVTKNYHRLFVKFRVTTCHIF